MSEKVKRDMFPKLDFELLDRFRGEFNIPFPENEYEELVQAWEDWEKNKDEDKKVRFLKMYKEIEDKLHIATFHYKYVHTSLQNQSSFLPNQPIQTNNSLQKSTSSLSLPIDRLNPKQIRAAFMIASGNNVIDVADKIGVHRTTVYRWQLQYDFIRFLNTLKHFERRKLENEVMSLNSLAIDAIHDLLKSENPTAKLNAAKFIIEKGLSFEMEYIHED